MNNLWAFTPELWSARVQKWLKNSLVWAAIARTEERATLTYWDRVHRPYTSDIYVTDYVKWTNIVPQDVTWTDEYLDVDQAKIVPFYMDRIDEIQNKYNVADEFARKSAYQLKDEIDKHILREVSNASLWNSSAITLNPWAAWNIISTFSDAKAELSYNWVEEDMWIFTILDPISISKIEQQFTVTWFSTVDRIVNNWYWAYWYKWNFLWIEAYMSQNVPHSVSLWMATNPTANDTVVINWVTFTFKAVPSVAWEVDIAWTAAWTVANLVAAINWTWTPSATTYIELDAADRIALKNKRVVATDDTTAIWLISAWRMVLSETLNADWDVFWTQTKTCFIGQYWCVDLVLQKDVSSELVRDPYKLWHNMYTWALYWTKMFKEWRDRVYKLLLTA